MISASLMPTGEATPCRRTFFPQPRRPSSTTASSSPASNLGRAFLNSALLATSVTVLVSLLFNSMAGYAFAKLRFRGRDRIFGLLLAALVIPAQVAMLPLFLLMRQLGLSTPTGA